MPLTPEEQKNMLETDPDFVMLKRFKQSLAEIEARYPEGAPDHIIAGALGMREGSVQKEYDRIVDKLRKGMEIE
jgi:hypothetical protein